MARAKISINQTKDVHTLLNTYGPFVFYADMFENPTSADWLVNSLASMVYDTSATVRAFDDTTAEAVGFSVYVPSNITKMKLTFLGRPASAPSSAKNVGFSLYAKAFPHNAAVGAWSSAFVAGTIVMPDSVAYYQRNTIEITLGSDEGEFNINANCEYQFELARKIDVTNNLTGDYYLRVLQVTFE